jgi:RNA polymerase sigma factor (sigma-70 family)
VLALQQLSARERLVFTLKACQHLTLRTVAQILDESEETLGRTFTRAVCKLRLAIAE